MREPSVLYDCGEHGSACGLIEEVLAGHDGQYLSSPALSAGPVPLAAGQKLRLTRPLTAAPQ